jgi:hypothetical protein
MLDDADDEAPINVPGIIGKALDAGAWSVLCPMGNRGGIVLYRGLPLRAGRVLRVLFAPV